jgi:signal transduction histidine kinase
MTGALRTLPVFEDLADSEIDWLVDHAEELRAEPGEVIARPGDPLDWMIGLFEGELKVWRGSDTSGPPSFVMRPRHLGGLLPYSRMGASQGTAVSVGHMWCALWHRSLFREMLQRIPVLGQRLVSLMADRIRDSARDEERQEALASLGKLSAGLAHELNNPAAATRRLAVQLRCELRSFEEAARSVDGLALSDEQRALIAQCERAASSRDAAAAVDPLRRAENEELIAEWLEARGVSDPWQLTSRLGEVGLDVATLDCLGSGYDASTLNAILTRVSSALIVERLSADLVHSTNRLTELVNAIRRFEGPEEDELETADIHEGLESALTMLTHQVKHGVQVERRYDRDLPPLEMRASEMTQVWVNIMDNAIDAMNGEGTLRIATTRDGDSVVVEIGDTGSGIPPDVQARMFEPFYTTKEVGKGSGLGLEIVSGIVYRHRGSIRVFSQPGDTRFQVRLPLDATTATLTASSQPIRGRPHD